jgi:hypothetical protein
MESMQLSELTPDEVEIIRQRREEQASRRAALDFQRKAITTAGAFSEWSARTGYRN